MFAILMAFALIAHETDRAGHAPLFPEANSNRFEQWPSSISCSTRPPAIKLLVEWQNAAGT